MDINTTVYKLPITSFISNFLSVFDSFAGTVAKASKTICTITALTLNCQIHVLINLFLLFFFNMMIHWDRKIHNLPRVLIFINQYHIWLIITYFPISLHWFVPVDCYFPIICLCYNIGYMAVPHIFCRDPMLLK